MILLRWRKKYGVGLKEHNADYLDDVTLLEHIHANVAASNIAPQYGTEETRAYRKLTEVEQILVREGLIKDASNIRAVLLDKAIKTERWRKWMVKEQRNLRVEDILQDEQLSLEILDISGHYAFNDDAVKAELSKMYANLAMHHIDGQRFVVDYIKRPILQYVECYNLKGISTRIEQIMKSGREDIMHVKWMVSFFC